MSDNPASKANISRRAALTRLGLGAAAVYAVPAVTRLDTAKAAFPSQCPPNRPGCAQPQSTSRTAKPDTAQPALGQ